MPKVANGETEIAEKRDGSNVDTECVEGAMALKANDAQGLAHSFIVLHGSPDSLTQPDFPIAASAASCPSAVSEAAGQAGRACPTTGNIATASAAKRLTNRRHIVET